MAGAGTIKTDFAIGILWSTAQNTEFISVAGEDCTNAFAATAAILYPGTGVVCHQAML